MPTFFFVLTALAAPPAQGVGSWEFYAVEARQNVGCSNPQTTQVGYSWLYRDANAVAAYTARRQQLKAEVLTRYKGDASAWPISISHGQPALIAISKRRVACRDFKGNLKYVDSFRFYVGASRAEISRRIESEIKGLRDVVGHEIVEWIDTRQEIHSLSVKAFGNQFTTFGIRG